MAAKSKRDRVASTVDLLLENDRLQRMEAYLRAGRRLQALDDEVLRARFIESFRRMAGDPRDAALRAANGEAEMELLVRKLEPPYDELQAEIAAFCAIAADAAEEDPETATKLAERLRAEIDALTGEAARKGKPN
jgi:hypothetical protein